MHDKRKHRRFTLNNFEVSGKMISATEMKVVDISVSGISLQVDRRLNIGGDYSLKLEGKTAVALRGTVMWCSLIETRKVAEGAMMPIYSAGLQFKNMTAEKISELLNFIENYKIEESPLVGGTRFNIRFHIKDPEKALLNFSASYRVKTISLGGMLIECVQDLEVESRIPMELFVHDHAPVTFVGRVASCKAADSDGQKQFRIGIEFFDLTETGLKVLAAFIEQSALTGTETAKEPEATAGKQPEEDIPDFSQEFIDKVDYLHKWHKTMGYYKMLGVREYATDEQIKHAFLAKTHELHPDKFPRASDDLKQKLTELFSYLNAARTTLLDPQKRKEYDKMPITRVRH